MVKEAGEVGNESQREVFTARRLRQLDYTWYQPVCNVKAKTYPAYLLIADSALAPDRVRYYRLYRTMKRCGPSS